MTDAKEAAQPPIKVGDRVMVIKKHEHENRFITIHRGIVMNMTTAFAQVYRPRQGFDDIQGDLSPNTAEFFAVTSDKVMVIKT